MIQHHFQFLEKGLKEITPHGYRIKVTKAHFPVLEGMSLYKLVLDAHAARAPHWHANSNELGYCLKGKIQVTFFSNQNTRQNFYVSAGEAFLIPSGALHAIENLEGTPAELILQFSHDEPKDFELSTSFTSFSNAVLGNTWNVQASHFSEIKKPLKSSLITFPEKTETSQESPYASPYHFALENSAPLIMNESGNAKVARENVWPVLKKQALYSLFLTNKGMREPHWHPETAEMGYVAHGHGRMTLLLPSGDINTYEMKTGDLYFIPKAYPHHIENLSKSALHLLIFFDQSMPQDIGFSGSLRAFSDKLLASTMKCPEKIFSTLPKIYEDRFIVEKLNPQD